MIWYVYLVIWYVYLVIWFVYLVIWYVCTLDKAHQRFQIVENCQLHLIKERKTHEKKRNSWFSFIIVKSSFILFYSLQASIKMRKSYF